MEEPDPHKSGTNHVSDSSSLDRSTSRRSTPGRSTSARSPSNRSTPGRSISGRSTSGWSTPGWPNSGLSISGRSTPATSTTPTRSTPDRSTTPEPPPVPPATYHWEEVKRKRSVGGYPWTHLNKPPFDENTWVKYERDHVYEPVTPAASMDRISAPVVKQVQASTKDDSRHFLRIPLTEELVMADDTGSEPESEPQQSKVKEPEDDDDENEEEDNEQEEDDEVDVKKKESNESIYEGENENSSVGDVDANKTRMKMFQQKVKVKADILRTKLQGVTKRKPKQKIVVDAAPNGEKSRRKFGQFATLPKKFTFNAPKVNFSASFTNFTSKNQPMDGHNNEAGAEDTKSGRFSMPRFGRFSRTSSESPRPSKSTKIGASRMSIPGFRSRTWSDASKTSKPEASRPKIMDFGTYPRIFSKRRKMNTANKAKTPPPLTGMTQPSGGDDGESNKLKDTFRRRFFRTHKESTPAPTEKQTATLAVEEELDESHVSKESLAEFGDSDLQEVISLNDDCSRRSKDTKSLSDHRPGVIEEIDSDEFFLREKGLSRGDVHISNYLSSEIRDVFRSNRTRSVESVNNNIVSNNKIHSNNNNNNNSNHNNDNNDSSSGFATPLRPSRTNSLKRPVRSKNTADGNLDRFSTMPKSFGGTKPVKKPEDDDMPENIITSQTFEPSQNGSTLPSTFRVPWRTSQKKNVSTTVTHMPPKPPTRQRMSKFSTFDTRSMIDLSRKRSQSQIGFLPSMNFSETVPKAPLRRSRTSLAGSERDVSATRGIRPSWAVDSNGGGGSGAPTPPLRRSRISLTTDVDVEERSAAATVKTRDTPPRPPPPTVAAGYATVDKSQSMSLLHPPQSPMRHRRKKSYDVIKSQEFGAFFTIPRSYTFNRNAPSLDRDQQPEGKMLPPPSRPARAYNTIGPSRPLRRRLPTREHEYGDVDTDTPAATTGREDQRKAMTMTPRALSLDDSATDSVADGSTKALFSGDVIEKMKLRPLPSPPPPPRIKTKAPNDNDVDNNRPRYPRRNTDSTLVPFLDQRETSATSSDDFFADVSRALLASAAKNTPTAVAVDDVSIGVQTDPLPDGYELDDAGSCCSGESDRPRSVASSCTTAAHPPTSRTSDLMTTDRPTSRTSTTCTEYVNRPTSRMTTVENGYVMLPHDRTVAGGVICAQRINVNELQVCKMTVADLRGQHMGVEDVKITHMTTAAVPSLEEAACATTTAAVLPSQCTDLHHLQDDAASVQSSRVSSSMYPEVDSEEDRTSVLAAPTPPRRRSKPSTSGKHSSANGDAKRLLGTPSAVDLSTDPSITELSCQLFRLCHSNVCSLFNKVVQQVVPEDTEKRRDLQAALCFLSIILAGLLILGFGNEKTIHHHHWDFQFPPSNQ